MKKMIVIQLILCWDEQKDQNLNFNYKFLSANFELLGSQMLKKLGNICFYTFTGSLFVLAPLDNPFHRYISDYKIQAYESLRPTLFKLMKHETVYDLEYFMILTKILPTPKISDDPLLEVEFPGGHKAKNPVCLAPGYDRDGRAIIELFDLGFGGIEVGSLTNDPEQQISLNLRYDFKNKETRSDTYGSNWGIMVAKGHLNSYYRSVIRQLREASQTGTTKNFNRMIGINFLPNLESQDHAPYLTESELEANTRETLEYANYLVFNLANAKNNAIKQFYNEKKLANFIQKIKRLRTLDTGYQAAYDYECRELLREKKDEPTGFEIHNLNIVYNHYDRSSPLSQNKTPLLFVKIDATLPKETLEKFGKLALEGVLDGIIVGSARTEAKPLKKGDYETRYEYVGGTSNKEAATDALKHLYKVTQGRVPLISSGGVFEAKEVLERMKNGASLVQIYTAFALRGPYMTVKLLNDLSVESRRELAANNLQNLNQLVGINLKQEEKK